jgi:RNA polymerase sigma factor (TIGR02999 family)
MTTPADERGEFTRLLEQVRDGDQHAFDLLVAMVYETLKEIARRQLSRRRQGSALCTTELVHEAYFKLAGQAGQFWQDRAQFCGIAANAMRQVLVDHARRRNAAKRGGDAEPITLTAGHDAVDPSVVDVLALDQALDRLGALNERLRRVVEYLFFGGMTQEEVAEVLGVSTRTVERDWLKAKLFLHRELHAGGA